MAPNPPQVELYAERAGSPSLSAVSDAAQVVEVSTLARSRRMQFAELGYDDIPQLSSLFAETSGYPLLMASPTRFIDVAAIVACAQRLYATSSGLGAWRANTLDDRFIGLFSLLPVHGGDDAEVHVRLKPEAWGHWYAIEGVNLLCRQAFDMVGLPRLFGYCHPDYRRIRRILVRFGFRDLGICRHRGQVAHRYQLDASTWRARNGIVAH